MSIIIGIDHGYYAIKTAHCSFPAGLTSYRQFLDGKIDYGVGYLIEKTDIRHKKAVKHSKKMTA